MKINISQSLCRALVLVMMDELTSVHPSTLCAWTESPKFYLSPESGEAEFYGPTLGEWKLKNGVLEGKRGKNIYHLPLRDLSNCPFPVALYSPDLIERSWKRKFIEYVHDIHIPTLYRLTTTLKELPKGTRLALMSRTGGVLQVIKREDKSMWNYFIWDTHEGELSSGRGIWLVEENQHKVTIYSPFYAAVCPLYAAVNVGEWGEGAKLEYEVSDNWIDLVKNFEEWKDISPTPSGESRIALKVLRELKKICPDLLFIRKQVNYNEDWERGGSMMGSTKFYEPQLDNLIYYNV